MCLGKDKMTIELVPAALFTIQELTDLYNQTRVDYLVPMPMNAGRLSEYISNFDVDLSHSCVARGENGQILGLSMLGVRPHKAWVTRLGVLPGTRRHGLGSMLMDCMLENADRLGAKEVILEVIQDNAPAYNLFVSKGFREMDTWLVMRRAPRVVNEQPQGNVIALGRDEILELLLGYPRFPTWINAHESMQNSSDLAGMQVELPSGARGWVAYRSNKFALNHLVLRTEEGDPSEVGLQLLLNLHTLHPRYDTYAENIHNQDPHLAAFHALGYFENFTRIEMRRFVDGSPL
jgi:ribosomal protein S18 acetylase RimI-like enzyme